MALTKGECSAITIMRCFLELRLQSEAFSRTKRLFLPMLVCMISVGFNRVVGYYPDWGTESAGLSELHFYSVVLRADLDNDNDVDILDLQMLVNNWLGEGDILEGDFNRDGQIDMLDLAILGEDWLTSLQE